MNKRLKTVPEFSSEAEERAFWEAPDNDSSEYVDSPNLVGLLLECRGFDHRAHEPNCAGIPYIIKRFFRICQSGNALTL
jgi:hypothetical protein